MSLQLWKTISIKKRCIYDLIEDNDRLRKKLKRWTIVPTLGISMIFIHYYCNYKEEKYETELSALKEYEKKIVSGLIKTGKEQREEELFLI